MDIQTHQHTSHTYFINASKNQDGIGEVKTENSHSAQLTEAEASTEQIIRELSLRDREVRAHEQAHKSAAGSLSQGAPSYTYQRGPDGKLYAIGGEVRIDTAAVKGDPQATIDKAQKIKRAALAPVNPSSQDRAVAAQANIMETQARAELQAQKNELSEDTIDTEKKDETAIGSNEVNGECAMCGGKHSADTHIIVSAINF